MSGRIANGTFSGNMTMERLPGDLLAPGAACQGTMALTGTVKGNYAMRLTSEGISTCGDMTNVVIAIRR